MEEDFTTMTFDPRDLQIRGAISGIDKEKRTFKMTLATETPVRAIDTKAWEIVDQVLRCTPEAADLSRIDGSGVGFFEIHPSNVRWSPDVAKNNQLGRITAMSFTGGKAIADVQFSTRKNDPHLEDVWHDIETGIRTSVSIGFNPLQVTRIETAEGQRNQMIVERWELMEGSLADVAASPDTAIQRSATRPDDYKEPKNLIEVRVKAATTINPTPAPIPTPIPIPKTRMEEKTPEQIAAETRAAELAAETRANEIVAEREARAAQINQICDAFGAAIKPETRAEYLKSKASVDEIRALAMAEWQKADPNKGASGGAAVTNQQSPAQRAERAALGIVLRSGALSDTDLKPEEVTSARQYRNSSLCTTARYFLEDQGISTRDMTDADVAKAALGFNVSTRSGGGMVSTDFPTALGNAINRILIKNYQMAVQTWQKLTKYRPAKDFRPMTSVQFGEAPRLERVPEGGEIRRGFMKDTGETYSIDHFAKIIAIGWRTFVNDDLGVFNDLAAAMGKEVAELKGDIVYDLILANPALDTDATAVFHTNHGNIAASGAALDQTSLKAAEKRFMKQTGIGTPTSAGRYLNLMPDQLIVGPDNYHAAQTLVNPLGVTLTSGSQLFQNKYEIITDARITDARFYLKNSTFKTIEHSQLDGRDFWLTNEQDFKTSGWEYKVETTFAAAFVDYRAMDYTPAP